jgi:hypothetical protein
VAASNDVEGDVGSLAPARKRRQMQKHHQDRVQLALEHQRESFGLFQRNAHRQQRKQTTCAPSV